VIAGAIMHFDECSFNALQNKMLCIHSHEYLQIARGGGGPSGEFDKNINDELMEDVVDKLMEDVVGTTPATLLCFISIFTAISNINIKKSPTLMVGLLILTLRG
jgi:hypothetical protein